MNKNKTIKLMFLAVLVVGLSGATNVEAAPSSSTGASALTGVIKVGVLIPYTGALSSVAEGIADGVRAAAYAVNESSDFAFDIELLVEDTALDIVTSTSAYNNFKGAGVELVIGAAASSVSTKIAELAKDDEIVQVSYASTAASLSNASLSYFYRTVPTDALQAIGHVEVLKDLGFKKIVIVNRQDDYGNGFADGVDDLWTALGTDYEVLAKIGYPTDTTSFGTFVTEVKKHEADGLSLITFIDEGAQLVTELRADGVSVPFVGVDGNADASFANASKTTATIVADSNNMFATKPHSPKAGEGGYDGFLADRTACRTANVCLDTNADPVIFEDTAYDAMMVGALAVKAADDYTGSVINTKVKAAGAAYTGATGNKEFSATTGDVVNADYDVVQFQDGELVLVASWNAADGLVKLDAWKDPGAAAPGFEAFYLFGTLAVISIVSLKIRKQKK
ncbi:MAG: ABC transporter substrate-binding protein [Candidatus Hodarchaeales archaeon]|jgi:branched-chain amino acid transport system substrate-binding protein